MYSIDLKPCPIPACGSKQVMHCSDSNNPGKSFVACRACGCRAPLRLWQQPRTHWIDVKERQPDIDDFVIWVNKSDGFAFIDHIDKDMDFQLFMEKMQPTHWVLLDTLLKSF